MGSNAVIPWYGLIRHGKTRWNREGRLQGNRDIPLSPHGRVLVKSWGPCLRAFGFDKILSSPLSRAMETAAILGDYLGIEVGCDPDIREQDFGLWEGKRLMEIEEKTPGAILEQEKRGWNYRPPMGESRAEVYTRASNALGNAYARTPDQTILVVTHLSVLKALIYNALGEDFLPGNPPDEPPPVRSGCLHQIRPVSASPRVRPNLQKLSSVQGSPGRARG